MNGVNLFAAVLARILESEFGDARGALLGDDLDGLHHAGDHLVLQLQALALGVFPHDDQVDSGPVRLQAGKILDGAEVGKEVKSFSQRDVDALESAADGSRHWPLQSHAVALDGLIERGGNVLAEDLEGLGPGGKALPLEAHAGGLQDADYGLRHLRPDAVAGNQRYLVRLALRHCVSPIPKSLVPIP